MDGIDALAKVRKALLYVTQCYQGEALALAVVTEVWDAIARETGPEPAMVARQISCRECAEHAEAWHNNQDICLARYGYDCASSMGTSECRNHCRPKGVFPWAPEPDCASDAESGRTEARP
jgi:hypothetical protein